jgi:hypothetical protein
MPIFGHSPNNIYKKLAVIKKAAVQQLGAGQKRWAGNETPD